MPTSPVKTDKSTQTKQDKYVLCAKIENTVLKNEMKTLKASQNKGISNPMAHEVILESPEKSKYFIGLSPAQFWALYDFLDPPKFNLTYWNESKGHGKKLNHSITFQFFITLLRLRRGFNILTIIYWYGASEYSIRTVFTTWIMFLFHQFKDHRYIMFPERQEFKETLPKLFHTFKNICASVDCTELKYEIPRNYSQQGNLYSSYKSHCTMKWLIAVNPNSAAYFISDLFEGSISDVDIFDQCGILQQINPGDALLVDKGFTIQHLLLTKQATIFIPPFLMKRDAFTKEEVMLTKRIAQARIHVERFNERLKKIRILDRVIPLNLTSNRFPDGLCCLLSC